MKLSSLSDIFAGAITPQLHQTPLPYGVVPSEEELPEDFFDEENFDEQAEDPNFQENIAEFLDESYLDRLASELLQEVEDDETDRQPWMDMIAKIQDQLGIGDDSAYDAPFPGANTVVYPLITKAQIQFQARALPEIFPNDPVNAVVLGEETTELEAQADRVKDVMNYQIQYQDPTNKKDFRKMLWWLPLTGSTFRYVYHDALKDMNVVRFVPVENLIVPYGTTSLADAYRIAYRFKDSKNDITKLINNEFYRYVDIDTGDGKPAGDEEEDNKAQELRDASDGFTRDSDNTSTGQNQICYNIYTYRDIPGYEDTGEDGKETGIALPYVFTIHNDTKKILAIRRNWKQDDEYKEQRIYFSHYKYQEGPGFYGSGLPHLIGSLQEATTGALRAFGDSLAFSIMPGGFKLKTAKISGNQEIRPGAYLDVDMDIDDINKGIKSFSSNPPTPQVLQYIELLSRQAEEIVSTTDIMTGDQSPQNSPVGSTLAMIEQANKVISAQHKSLHESLSEEFRILAELNYDFLPDQDNFVIPGRVGVIMRSDFDGKIDVIPTADPSVSSFQQRQAIDQATMQLANIPEFKPFFKESGYPLLQRMLKNLSVPNIDAIIMDEQEALQAIQQQQQNPPPNPDLIKAQVMQQDSQTKAQSAQADAQIKAQQMQFDQQMEAANKQIEMLKLQLQEKSIDMQFATNDKMIDARFLGSVAPALQQSSDAKSAQIVQNMHELTTQQQDQQHQMNMQRMQAVAQAATQPQPGVGEAPPQVPDPQAVHAQMMQAQQASQQPQQPQQSQQQDKQGMLVQLMNKIRGR